MIGMVLVTHGHLATEFSAALEHVVGPQKQIETITIGPDDDMETPPQGYHRRRPPVDTGDGVVVLTDMFGGTPSNLAISLHERPQVEVVAGINLPMLIKLASVRDEEPLATGGAPGAGGRPQIHQRRDAACWPENERRSARSAPRRGLPAAPIPEGALARELPIINRKGLHARASAKFVQTVDASTQTSWSPAAARRSAAAPSWAC